MEEEDWEEDAPVMECSQCGKVKRCHIGPDPFLTELYPEDGPYPEVAWCFDCWCDRKDDI